MSCFLLSVANVIKWGLSWGQDLLILSGSILIAIYLSPQCDDNTCLIAVAMRFIEELSLLLDFSLQKMGYLWSRNDYENRRLWKSSQWWFGILFLWCLEDPWAEEPVTSCSHMWQHTHVTSHSYMWHYTHTCDITLICDMHTHTCHIMCDRTLTHSGLVSTFRRKSQVSRDAQPAAMNF